MKIKNFLKYLMPIIGLSTLAITLPVTLVSCSKNGNSNKTEENKPNDNNPIIEDKITTSINKLENLAKNFDSIIKTEIVKIDNQDHVVTYANSLQKTLLENIGVPNNFVKKINLTKTNDVSKQLKWEFSVELKDGYQFPSLSLNGSQDSLLSNFTLTTNSLIFRFSPNFDYVLINLNQNNIKNYLQSFVESIYVRIPNSLVNEQTYNLNSDYEKYKQNSSYDWFTDSVQNINLNNFQKVNEHQYNYTLNLSPNEPFKFINDSNLVNESTSITKLQYNIITIDFNQFKDKLNQLITEFSNSASSFTNEQQLKDSVKSLETNLSKAILNKDSGVNVTLHKIESNKNQSYNLSIYLPGNYHISNLSGEPNENTQFISNGYYNGIQYMNNFVTNIN